MKRGRDMEFPSFLKPVINTIAFCNFTWNLEDAPFGCRTCRPVRYW